MQTFKSPSEVRNKSSAEAYLVEVVMYELTIHIHDFKLSFQFIVDTAARQF